MALEKRDSNYHHGRNAKKRMKISTEDAESASGLITQVGTGAVLANESFPSRESLQERIGQLQARGENGPLAGQDLELAKALLSLHPQLSSQSAFLGITYGEHVRFPGAKCFIMTSVCGTKTEPLSFKKVLHGLFPR